MGVAMTSQDDILTIPDVAGQWRFSRTAIDSWIKVKTNAAGVQPDNVKPSRSSREN